jgi:hypothetical protein
MLKGVHRRLSKATDGNHRSAEAQHIYKPRRGLNEISVLSSSRHGHNLTRNRAVDLANADLTDGLQLRIGREPLSCATPD